MDRRAKPAGIRGVVVSDLHLFASRSCGDECLHSIRGRLAAASVLVLNGDIFDFRWSTRGDFETSVGLAIDWLHQLLSDFPDFQVHYILGNHDCLALFIDQLALMALREPRIKFHEHCFQIGSTLFLHGDCADQRMDPVGFQRRRASWERDHQRGAIAASAYVTADRLGLTRLALVQRFPREATIKRIVHYLDRALPHWQETVRDCYFGHTHLPFSNYGHGGVAFHNTGSGIRGMEFNPLFFEVDSVSRAFNVCGHFLNIEPV